MPLRSVAPAFLAFSLFLTGPAMAAFEQLGELEKVGARVTAIAIDLGDLSVVAERNQRLALPAGFAGLVSHKLVEYPVQRDR